MRIVFDIDLDHGCWPGPLESKLAELGEAWVGPVGFMDILETRLGLGGAYPSKDERALRLVREIRSREGFWSRSAEADPFGTAVRLLEWRDELWMCGWRGQAKSHRLKQLARITRDVEPGIPDRVQEIIYSLGKREIDIERISMFGTPDELYPVWREVFSLLQDKGVDVVQQKLEPAAAKGDLAGCRLEGFEPRGDGSLQLMRSTGFSDAAEQAAAWLSSIPEGSSSIVIWPGAVLDHALRRHGLPTLGAPSGSHNNAMLSILPFVLELGWNPQDPEVAFELLMLPRGPVRKKVAEQLVSALQDWPAVGSYVWHTKLRGALSAEKDPGQRARVKKRIATIFDAPVSRSERYPAKEIRRRVKILEEWVQGYRAENRNLSGECNEVIRQCSVVTGMLDACAMPDFSTIELGFIVERSNFAVQSRSYLPSQAGMTAVEEPGALAGEVDYVLFWDFTLTRFERPGGLPLSAVERREMAAAGVEFVEPSEQALRKASRWRRPFEMARKGVLCSSPMRSREGEEEFPHPAWDEIASRAGDGAHLLEVKQAIMQEPLERMRKKKKNPVRPTQYFSVSAGALRPRESESASSLEKLISCPLEYVLHYKANLDNQGFSPPPAATSNLIRGRLAHHLVAKVLGEIKNGKKFSPAEGQREMEKAFDKLAPELTAGLFLPGNEDARASLRMKLGLFMRDLLQILEEGGFYIAGLEQHVQRSALGGEVTGFIDLLLDDPMAIIDFKWSGVGKKREKLALGCALQLAVYSHVVGGKYPGVAYYIVSSRRLLTTAPDLFPGAEAVEGPGPEITWRALERAFKKKWEDLGKGLIASAGLGDEIVSKPRIEDGTLKLPAGCKYCDFAALCGRCFEKE